MGDAPFTQPGDIAVVKLHPVVLFSILDHYMRRNEGQRRVIGTLLGNMVGDALEIHNCFPVPHVEKDEEVAVGKDFNRQMYNLHQKVSNSEEIMGWYATAMDASHDPVSAEVNPLINTGSCLIHDYYSSECGLPIHLVVDTNLTNYTLAVKAFVSEPLTAGDRPLAAAFKEIKVEIVYEEPERIAVDLMKHAQIGDVATVESELEGLERSLKKLLELIETTQSYIDGVVSGKVTPDPQIGSRIAQVISSVPRIKPQVFAQSFQKNLKDMLMLVYLSNMTRTQLAVAERLSNTVS